MLQFKELTLSDRECVNEQLRRYPPQVSELTFTNLWTWRRMHEPWWARVDGTMVFAAKGGEEGFSLLGPPVGPADPTDLLDALSDAGVMNGERLDESAAEDLRKTGIPVEKDRDNSDYVYLVEELATLEGRKFHSKKNMVNRCESSYRCEYEQIGPDNIEEVRDMQERWGDRRDCQENRMLCAEHQAIMDALDHYEDFGLLGGAVRIAGTIEAFTIGERLADDTAVVHFEKAMTKYTGLYQLVNYWFCQNELDGFTFVNREQDLGIRGLRKAKESYHPHHMVHKYVACWEPAGVPCCKCELHGRCAEHGLDEGGDHA
jgi:hypothetical protein